MDIPFNAKTIDGSVKNFSVDDISIDYSKLRKDLEEPHLMYLIDQIKKLSGKKCAILFGNCQLPMIAKILVNNMEFRKKFFIVNLPAIFAYEKNDLVFRGGGGFLQTADLFITQRVREMNRFGEVFSTRNMLQNIRDDSKIVFVPNLFFMGYFPQYVHNQRNVDTDKDPAGRFIHGDRILDKIMEKSEMNPDVEKILDTICDENFIPTQEIQAYIDFSLDEFKKRESICDVKISDFIENNYKYKQLFYSPNHPFQFLLFELVRRILKFIGIRSESFYHLNEMLDENCYEYSLIGEEVPIYPAVRKFFAGTELLEKFYANRHFWDLYADFRDFTREYIRLCWHEKFTR